MIRLIAHRGAVLLASAMAGSIVVFLLLRLLGGDVATVIMGQGGTPEAREALRAELGLDRSWLEQYLSWIGGLFRGDLGQSYAAQYDIFDEIMSRLGLTLSLALISLAVSMVLGIIAGTYSALNSRNARGGLVDVIAQLGIAIPPFWVGLLLISFVSVQMGWLPSGGYVPWTESFTGAVRSLFLPLTALSIALAGVFTRFARSSMLDVLNEDYIRTAMAKGRTWRRAAVRHGVRNAAIPLVTVGTLQLGGLLAGTVVIETVFTLPGLGRMLMAAVTGREALVVQSLAFVIILVILVLNFLMDVAYGLLDPRIRDAEGATRE
ncbi:ABC transporter permease [Phytoactinopolyspora alkaliphila]|uniref:ABC transporter permease n=1 Tax=Phytoactinopolyspora alkaliphila TaxID=1783498 RepID=A0A6N9YID1_9ACTN|nr:ABC transporter permease [Phytoactinopolyspora alkaliphila]NED94753.1 ABC transporter permease [Phytoactinopolyspora alkaliphila]